MIVIIGKPSWVLAQLRQAAAKFQTLGEWHRALTGSQHTNQPPVLIQRKMDLH